MSPRARGVGRAFFDRLLFAVDRIYGDETLKAFWRRGELVPNRAHKHPYQENIPGGYENIDRWFLLDTGLDRPRPWELKTDIPVFSLAVVMGEKTKRRWLVYAHSPLKDRRGVSIVVPGFGDITVDVPRGGAFYLVDGGDGSIKPVAAALSKRY